MSPPELINNKGTAIIQNFLHVSLLSTQYHLNAHQFYYTGRTRETTIHYYTFKQERQYYSVLPIYFYP